MRTKSLVYVVHLLTVNATPHFSHHLAITCASLTLPLLLVARASGFAHFRMYSAYVFRLFREAATNIGLPFYSLPKTLAFNSLACVPMSP